MLKALILNILLIMHPVHITTTNIDQAPGSDTLKVFFRIYYDDFLRDFRMYNSKFNLDEFSGGRAISDVVLNKYFNDRIQIYINNKLLTGKLIASSNDGYEMTLRLVFRSDIVPEKFKIRNQILTALYNDQKNMVYLSINKYEYATMLTAKRDKESRILK